MRVLSSNEVSEPRREMSLALLISIAEKVDETDFREVQAFFILLIMYFTYSPHLALDLVKVQSSSGGSNCVRSGAVEVEPATKD